MLVERDLMDDLPSSNDSHNYGKLLEIVDLSIDNCYFQRVAWGKPTKKSGKPMKSHGCPMKN